MRDIADDMPLSEQVKRHPLPRGPGVYLFKDARDRVIYVGKAKNLHKRVLSYFRPDTDLSTKTLLMMKGARALDTILTATEKEAFILESNLIKKYLPRYNIILRDDKRYPCLRLDIQSPFPHLTIVRKIKKDGALYFGPFSSADAVRRTHRVIDRVFKLRKCGQRELKKRSRPCLNFQMNRCPAPCTYDISPEQYREMVDQVRLFLEGRNQELLKRLQKEMHSAAAALDFEKAAGIRDQIAAVEKTVERQHVVSPRMEDQDVIGISQKEHRYQVVMLYVRKGYLIGTRSYRFRDKAASPADICEAFLKQYYARGVFLPREVLLSHAIEDQAAIREWLSNLAGKKILIRTPQRGEKKRLIAMAVQNAENLLQQQTEDAAEEVMERIGRVCMLKKSPRIIEGLDISTLQGSMAVGAVVSFVGGQAHPAGYRNYRIKAFEGIDDYGMMGQLAARRLKQGNLPDLFLIDGGKGHLRAVKRVVDGYARKAAPKEGEWKDSDPDLIPGLISIAKPDADRNESSDKIYLPGRKNPLPLKADDPVLLLMMRIRDEAHRRAIGYHRMLMTQGLTQSDLDRIPGIGPKRKQRLLRHFNGIQGVSRASVDALEQVPGIPHPVAEAIVSFFKAARSSTEQT